MTLIERMQELLEAERAGLICFEQMAFLGSNKQLNRFFTTARNDEATFCEGLHSLIMQREGIPTTEIGGFAEKVNALDSERERIGLIVKGMAWVVRKIDEFPQSELNEDELSFFTRMRQTHIENLRMLNSFLG